MGALVIGTGCAAMLRAALAWCERHPWRLVFALLVVVWSLWVWALWSLVERLTQ